MLLGKLFNFAAGQSDYKEAPAPWFACTLRYVDVSSASKYLLDK